MFNKRKVMLINQKFQLSVLAWVALLAIFIIGAFYSTTCYFFYKLEHEALSTGLPANHVYFTFLGEQKTAINHIFFITSVVVFGLVFFGGLYLSHKIAGPIHQFVAHLSGHSKDNVTPLQFRKGDYFLEIQESFNEFIKR